ncbi:MAG: ATP-binding protein, partial [Myxococcota bacterium]
MTPDELRALREGWDFEAKLATGQSGKGELPQTFWETYSAFANTRGGKVLLGAKERSDGSFDFRGIQDARKVETDLWNLLKNPQKVSANLLSENDVEVFELDGKTLMLIHVPKAPRDKRPVHIKGSWKTGTYLRVHEGDHRASEETARRMLADAIPARDSAAIDDATFDDLDADSIYFYRGLLAASRPGHPFLESVLHPIFAEKLG